jgi:hypothetical protein
MYIPGIKDRILVPTRFEGLGFHHQGVRFNSLVPNIYMRALLLRGYWVAQSVGMEGS